MDKDAYDTLLRRSREIEVTGFSSVGPDEGILDVKGEIS